MFLRQLGYKDSFAFSVGSLDNSDSLGWRGADGTLDLKDVMQRISVVKSIQGCPSYIYAGFEKNGKIFTNFTWIVKDAVECKKTKTKRLRRGSKLS